MNIGDKVFYTPSKSEKVLSGHPSVPFVLHGTGPYAALVTHVDNAPTDSEGTTSANRVSVVVFDSNGIAHGRTDVALAADDEGSAYVTTDASEPAPQNVPESAPPADFDPSNPSGIVPIPAPAGSKGPYAPAPETAQEAAPVDPTDPTKSPGAVASAAVIAANPAPANALPTTPPAPNTSGDELTAVTESEGSKTIVDGVSAADKAENSTPAPEPVITPAGETAVVGDEAQAVMTSQGSQTIVNGEPVGETTSQTTPSVISPEQSPATDNHDLSATASPETAEGFVPPANQ